MPEPTPPRDPSICFDPDAQCYRMPARPSLSFRRCSEFVESFFEPFDGPKIAEKLVTSYAKYAERTVEELVAEWDKAADDGTAVHGEVQRFIQEGLEPGSLRARHAANWLDAAYPAEDCVRESEVIICHEDLRVAGTADLLVRKISGDRWVLVDWKTNKKIERRPFNNKRGVRGPARAWPDCNYFKYSLQISLYRYVLETRRHLAFDGQLIVHLTEAAAVPIPCDYLRSQVEALIDHDISGPAMFAAFDAL